MANKTFRKSFSTLAASTLLVGLLATPAQSETVYSAPIAPEVTSATGVAGGIKVSWKAPAETNPSITNYIVSAGVGSCPVIVKGNVRSAVIPALNKLDQSVSVQAVNAYGISPLGNYDELVAAKSVAPKSIKSVQVLQLSDFHGAIETTSSNIGAPILASAFAADRELATATVTVSSGDNFGASPVISSAFEELPTVEAMNAMKFDASTFGNHEHDQNLEHLNKMIDASSFKWVVSNYSSLQGVKALRYTIINRGGVKIGLVGANTAETKDVVFPGNLDYTVAGAKKTIQISSSTAPVAKAAADARKAGADFVIALVHEGWADSANGRASGGLITYASKIRGVDAIYGGHSHNQFSSVINGVLTAQVKNSGVQYTRTQICVDTAKNRVLGSSVEFVNKADVSSGLVADATADAVVAKYKAQVTAKFDQKIGVVASIAPRGGTPAVERSSEAAIGSYAADALLKKYSTDFVLINGGGIRDTFPAATYKPLDATLRRAKTGYTGPYDVTLGDAYAVFPFGNSVSTTTITGAKLWEALENGVSQYPSAGRWPQIAGFKFTVDTTKSAGSRVTAVTTLGGVNVARDDKSYTIATLDFMVYGGDGYTQFDPAKVKVRDLLVDVFVDALKADLVAGKTTAMVTDGRISVIK
jgi:5'-nucleotidase